MTHSRSILVVLAHPDDESFPIGGTLARYSVEGTRIVLVSATRGEAGIPGLTAERVGQIREGELLHRYWGWPRYASSATWMASWLTPTGTR